MLYSKGFQCNRRPTICVFDGVSKPVSVSLHPVHPLRLATIRLHTKRVTKCLADQITEGHLATWSSLQILSTTCRFSLIPKGWAHAPNRRLLRQLALPVLQGSIYAGCPSCQKLFSVLCGQESLCSLERPVEVQIQNSVESLLFHLALLSRNEGNPRLASGARPLVSRDISGNSRQSGRRY